MCNNVIKAMAAANYTNHVLQMFNGAIREEENRNLRQPLLEYVDFKLVQTDFRGWFHVWRMDFPENYENGDDFLTFANGNKYKFVNFWKRRWNS